MQYLQEIVTRQIPDLDTEAKSVYNTLTDIKANAVERSIDIIRHMLEQAYERGFADGKTEQIKRHEEDINREPAFM